MPGRERRLLQNRESPLAREEKKKETAHLVRKGEEVQYQSLHGNRRIPECLKVLPEEEKPPKLGGNRPCDKGRKK